MSVYPGLQLSPRFTVEDLSISDTATRLSLNNLPPENLIPGMKKLANLLDEIWDKYGSFNILSGYRSPEVNSAVGGAKGSKHMSGTAIDLVPQNTSITEYWTNLISDMSVAPQLGEISLKPDQNSIHLTLPYWKGASYIQNSPRIKEGGSYYQITGDYGQKLLSNLGINLTKEEVKQIIQVGGIGVGIMLLGAGAFFLVMAMRK